MQSYYKALLASFAAVGLVWVPFVNVVLAIAAPLYCWKTWNTLKKRRSPNAGIAFTGLLISLGVIILLIMGYMTINKLGVL